MSINQKIADLPHEPISVQRARQLLLRYGRDASCWQITNPGMELWFSQAGDAVVGFVHRNHVRLAAGSPVCAMDRMGAVLQEFESDAALAGQRVCYFAAETPLVDRYRHSGIHSILLLGAQPVWRPSHWSEIVMRHASLRAQINRARNKGVSVTEWPIEQALNHPELRICLRQWLASRRLPALHFLVEPDTLGRLSGRRIFVAERDGRAAGFLLASPVPQRNGWLIEQIVRGYRAPNGSAEMLVDAAMDAMAAGGYEYVTLGLAPLTRRAGLSWEHKPAWLGMTLAGIRKFGSGFYNFDGLDAFKAKFQPQDWEPVFAISNEPGFSVSTLYAIASAFCQGSPALTLLQALKDRIRVRLSGAGHRPL
jgi:phosphatidylglycerol lysyltransferase